MNPRFLNVPVDVQIEWPRRLGQTTTGCPADQRLYRRRTPWRIRLRSRQPVPLYAAVLGDGGRSETVIIRTDISNTNAEPSTWAMIPIGFAGLGLLGVGREGPLRTLRRLQKGGPNAALPRTVLERGPTPPGVATDFAVRDRAEGPTIQLL
jgi:hypothetical protein